MPTPAPRFRSFTPALIAVFALLSLAARAEGQSPYESKPKRHNWASASLGLSVPMVRDFRDEAQYRARLIPAGILSWLLGAGWGPTVLGARLDFGLGGLKSVDPHTERGIGYVLSFGPVARTYLYSGAVNVAVVAEASLMHFGTAAEQSCGDGCITTYPPLRLTALAPGAALQFTSRRKKNLLVELRYQRPYWFRWSDAADSRSMRAWDFMPSDQWTVSIGGWFAGG